MTALRTLLALAVLTSATIGALPIRAGEATIEVWKSPSCGCCSGWVEHLRGNGFEVVTNDLQDLLPVKRMAGVPEHLQACHTAKVGDYVIEGHVPASAIQRLLEERPGIKGLAVPGMPAGSPGMPSPTPERYHVLSFGEGEPDVFATFRGADEE